MSIGVTIQDEEIININLREALRGADGKSATLKIGSVSYSDTLSVTNSGTETDAVLDITFTKPDAQLWTSTNW